MDSANEFCLHEMPIVILEIPPNSQVPSKLQESSEFQRRRKERRRSQKCMMAREGDETSESSEDLRRREEEDNLQNSEVISEQPSFTLEEVETMFDSMHEKYKKLRDENKILKKKIHDLVHNDFSCQACDSLKLQCDSLENTNETLQSKVLLSEEENECLNYEIDLLKKELSKVDKSNQSLNVSNEEIKLENVELQDQIQKLKIELEDKEKIISKLDKGKQPIIAMMETNKPHLITYIDPSNQASTSEPKSTIKPITRKGKSAYGFGGQTHWKQGERRHSYHERRHSVVYRTIDSLAAHESRRSHHERRRSVHRTELLTRTHSGLYTPLHKMKNFQNKHVHSHVKHWSQLPQHSSNVSCYFCGIFGHVIHNCPVRKNVVNLNFEWRRKDLLPSRTNNHGPKAIWVPKIST